MPIYEFRCRDCGTVTETLVMAAEQGKTCTCRKCGGSSTQRIISRPAAMATRTAGGEHVTGNGASTVMCPDNDDYIRLKGQQ